MTVVWARAVVLLAFALALAACSWGDAQPEPASTATVSLRLGFTQLLPEEGSRNGLLRVENSGSEPVTVTGIGLSWPGYGEAFTEREDAMVAAGRTLDMKLVLPPPRCEAVDAPVVATVVTPDTTVTQRLTRYGSIYVRRLWERQCSERLVRERVAIEYGDRWVQRGAGTTSSAVGVVRLTRREGDDAVALTGVQGSVLYELRLTGPRVLVPGDDQTHVSVALLPGNRCDEHARGQATAPFDFLLRLRIGEVRNLAVALVPPPSGQAAATEMLERACR